MTPAVALDLLNLHSVVLIDTGVMWCCVAGATIVLLCWSWCFSAVATLLLEYWRQSGVAM